MKRKQRIGRADNAVYCFIVKDDTKEHYVRLLGQIYRKNVRVKNCRELNGGSVFREADNIISKHSDYYSGYVIWLDRAMHKTALSDRESDAKNSLETRSDVEVYFSHPCFENWLLAHFRKTMSENAKPDSCGKELKKYIPEYEKKCTLQIFSDYIDEKQIRRAMLSYPEIGEFLKKYFMR